jgi:hypothetical protein
MRRRSDLVEVAARALTQADLAEARAARAARALDRLPGLLSIHSPHARPPADLAGGEPPTAWCDECAQLWPCRTLLYAYGVGEYAEASAEDVAVVSVAGLDGFPHIIG